MVTMKPQRNLPSVGNAVILSCAVVLCFMLNFFFFSFRNETTFNVEATATTNLKSRTAVAVCPTQSIESLKAKEVLKSQSGEDLFLFRWFKGLCGGRFIEMGALDGVRYSNSYLFDFALGWKGLLVEVTPTSFEKLQVNRPGNVLVNAGICEKRQKVHYFGHTGVATTGIVEFTSADFREQFWNTLKPDLSNTVEIDCVPLQDIVDEHFRSNIRGERTHFDFFSLDVEGAEYHVLKSIDYAKVSFGIILVEADSTNEKKHLAIRMFLESKGYVFLQEAHRSYWFTHPDFHKIYEHVLDA